MTKSDLNSDSNKKQKNIPSQCTHEFSFPESNKLSKIEPESNISAKITSVEDVIKRIKNKETAEEAVKLWIHRKRVKEVDETLMHDLVDMS